MQFVRVFTVHVVLPGLKPRKIRRTKCPLTAACSVVTAFTSLSVGCLLFQLSGGAGCEVTPRQQISANEHKYKIT